MYDDVNADFNEGVHVSKHNTKRETTKRYVSMKKVKSSSVLEMSHGKGAPR